MDEEMIITDSDFRPHFIAYFDILGYKQHMEKGRSVEIANKIASSIEGVWENFDMRKYGGDVKIPEDEAKLKVFSDNFIICSERDWHAVLQNAIRVQMHLALNDVLVRGSLCYGNLFFSNEFLSGEGIVLAHEIESQTAIYPRVVVDKLFMDEAQNQIDAHVERLRKKPHNQADFVKEMLDRELEYITIDFDGCMFVDYLKYEISSYEIQRHLPNDPNRETIKEILTLHRDNIARSANSSNRKISQKYQWCRNYHK